MNHTAITGNPRHDKLISLVMDNGYISNEELANILDVTTQTIRRDIRVLSQMKLISRHHGGAGRVSSIDNTDFSIRETSHIEEKKSIANKIAEYIPDGSTLFITIGTTVECIAKALEVRKNLRIITNSLRVANVLYQNENFEVITVGGILRAHNSGIIGPNVVSSINSFRADYLITSLGAVAEDGTLLDFDINEVAVVKSMLENSKKLILALDHSKFHTSAAVEVGHLNQVDLLFTDKKPPAYIMDLLKMNKVEVFLTNK
ncbi:MULTISPECIES: DeoR/GlpR family DNA-binding transcription regulator [Testudinibacter]|uniref:DeoR family transcriptional regulator n=1 Tax=Testudinibacter aquarius TaxID=1524974 RepID=A0A4R3YC72_9PAST|nr:MULTISPECIES: DeoR/GlpR family DNA-binding transcription regulator [Testudinibacter]TNH03641.1 DeoR/GlpR transcriptional regulator [Pasteurellaceae bacterium Phil11]KAE9530204.1 DeoR family transcriptional regulator [Testudinibacter aquarius]TCV87993.1 DeoR family transcriptional regulator [Testudinibacter aquarius]TNG91758.1 DeoR/GlpR transcriptional regulator [Testudinibacter aquarius]TNH23347.1 DeoR/GlpR transcriptional regulator [Testudinibacter sp. TR-2022]